MCSKCITVLRTKKCSKKTQLDDFAFIGIILTCSTVISNSIKLQYYIVRYNPQKLQNCLTKVHCTKKTLKLYKQMCRTLLEKDGL